jgi:GNAT superfamily N-acetyltransferase
VDVTIRPATAADADFLTDMAVAAVNWEPGRALTRDQLLSIPALARYLAGWPRRTDIGFVAESRGQRLGATWLRLLPPEDPGYGFVAADVPELSIAVVATHRGQGIGRGLLRALIAAAHAAGHPRLSLSVERANPARALYAAEGFRPVGGDANAYVMVRDLP